MYPGAGTVPVSRPAGCVTAPISPPRLTLDLCTVCIQVQGRYLYPAQLGV